MLVGSNIGPWRSGILHAPPGKRSAVLLSLVSGFKGLQNDNGAKQPSLFCLINRQGCLARTDLAAHRGECDGERVGPRRRRAVPGHE